MQEIVYLLCYLFCAGHVVVTDFNIAVIVAPGLPINSLSGTSLYMGNKYHLLIKVLLCLIMYRLAPEIFAPPPEGYSYAIDWWSLGVSAYEMLGTQVYKYTVMTFFFIFTPVASIHDL